MRQFGDDCPFEALIAELPHRSWTLTSEQIDEVLRSLREREPLLAGVT